MHRHQQATKHARKAKQLLSEENLREKGAKNALARLAHEQAVEVACTVFEGVLAKETRAEKAECNRIALIVRNPVITCHVAEHVMDDEFHGHEEPVEVRIPFAALPLNAQRAAVCAAMLRKA